MATHARIEPELNEGLKLIAGGQPIGSPEQRPSYYPKLHRVITREQGRALEMIGHAVDYLQDCYLHEGDDDEILDFRGPKMDAVRILVSAQRQIHRSLPLAEPLTVRLWHALLRRKTQYKSAAVMPVSSSR